MLIYEEDVAGDEDNDDNDTKNNKNNWKMIG